MALIWVYYFSKPQLISVNDSSTKKNVRIDIDLNLVNSPHDHSNEEEPVVQANVL